MSTLLSPTQIRIPLESRDSHRAWQWQWWLWPDNSATWSPTETMPDPHRTWQWIVFSCLTTLLPANSIILRPDPVTTTFKRTLLVLVLNVKTLLFPHLVLFEAVTQYGTAKIIRDRVNAAAELCHKASLLSNNVGPAVMDPPQNMWDKMKSWVFGKNTCVKLVTVITSGSISRNGRWPTVISLLWEGGFTVCVPPTTDDGLFFSESLESQEVVSLRPQQLFALLEKDDPSKARFDFVTQISDVQIKQLHEYSSTGHLVTIFGRLLMFAWYCYQRLHSKLETSPLEVLTVGHIFMAVLIEIFWWDKPPYLRLPIQNLDREALCQAIPGLERELKEVSAAQGKKTVDAYTSSPTFRVLQWLHVELECLPGYNLDKIGLNIYADYGAIIVLSLSACHSAILTRPRWRVSFPSDHESAAWLSFNVFFIVSTFVAVLAALDTVVRHIAEKSPRLRRLYGAFEDDTPTKRREFGANIEYSSLMGLAGHAILFTIAYHYAANVVAAIVNFRQASKGIYVVGPGDAPKYNSTIF